MSIGLRLIVVGLLLALGALAYSGYLARESRTWDEMAGTRSLQVQTAELKAQRTRSGSDIAAARNLAKQASMTGEDRFRMHRYVANGTIGVGGLFALLGLALIGTTSPKRKQNLSDDS